MYDDNFKLWHYKYITVWTIMVRYNFIQTVDQREGYFTWKIGLWLKRNGSINIKIIEWYGTCSVNYVTEKIVLVYKATYWLIRLGRPSIIIPFFLAIKGKRRKVNVLSIEIRHFLLMFPFSFDMVNVKYIAFIFTLDKHL